MNKHSNITETNIYFFAVMNSKHRIAESIYDYNRDRLVNNVT